MRVVKCYGNQWVLGVHSLTKNFVDRHWSQYSLASSHYQLAEATWKWFEGLRITYRTIRGWYKDIVRKKALFDWIGFKGH